MTARPPPRGRAALIEAMRARTIKPGETAKPEEAETKPRGRAALLNKLMALKIGSSTGPVSAPATAQDSPLRASEPIEEEKPICSFKGTAGDPVYMTANYIRLAIEKDKGVFEYELRFTPDVDAKYMRVKILNTHIAEMGGVKTFDGGSTLYLPIKLPEACSTFKCPHPLDGTEITMTVTFKKAKRMSDCVHLFNVLFKRIMVTLEYSPMRRNYYDTKNSAMVPQHKLEVLPGYAMAVDEYEGGLMLCLDAQHRVLRTDTALDLLNEIRMKRTQRFKEEVLKSLIGSIVLTKYNNNTYPIDDVLWDANPKSTFETSNGEISFVTYYKAQYGITIRDLEQPLLLHIRKVYKTLATEPEERHVILIPELCHLTGLSDEMRSDFRVMKDVAQFTRISPHQRLSALRKYVQNIRESPKSLKILSDWGMTIENATIDLNARILTPEIIVFGDGVMHHNDYKADWSGPQSRNSVLVPVDITNWVIVHTEKDNRVAQEFADNMQRLSNAVGFKVTMPQFHKLKDDRTNSYLMASQKVINEQVQVIVFICPTARADLYSTIKKVCCVQRPVPSQVILSRTLLNPKKVRTVTLKIALQITCKMGGSLWTLKIPCKAWMVIGIDVYHSPGRKSNSSVCGFVSSLSDNFNVWYSSSSIQEKELGNHLKLAFIKSLEKFREVYGQYPAKVIIFRDGVGDGQLSHCQTHEVSQFEDAIKEFGLSTEICMVIVQKRINTRMIMKNPDGGQPMNPHPGSIVDNTITKRHMFDYYLVPQNVNQGTVTPTHYIVINNNANIKPDHLQKLTFKLCHLYYNWSGTIRVPAPCQYAHKLAFLVGQHIGKVPSETLNQRLFYL